MKQRIIDWTELGELLTGLVDKIQSSGEEFDGIIGLSRGGLPIATHLSHQLYIPISLIIRASSYDKYNQQGELRIYTQFPDDFDTTKKYLIVDDICDTGQTLTKVSEILPNSLSCVLVHKIQSQFETDFWVEEGDKWVVFPWEKS